MTGIGECGGRGENDDCLGSDCEGGCLGSKGSENNYE